jgi:hypothetical protein
LPAVLPALPFAQGPDFGLLKYPVNILERGGKKRCAEFNSEGSEFIMEETLRVFFVILIFFFIGTIATALPKKVQQKHLKLLSQKKPYKGWMEGDIYISLVRYFGLFFLVMSVSMTFVRLFFPWVPHGDR